MSLLPPLPLRFDAALRDRTSRRAESRLSAVMSLADPPSGREAEATKALRPLLDDPIGPVRHAAILAIGRLRDAGALDVVLARFDDGDATVRQAAIIAAGMIGDPRAKDRVRAALSDARPEVRFQAAASFVELAPDEAPSALSPLLDDDDPEVRASVVEALGSLPMDAPAGAGLAEALAGKVGDADVRVRGAAGLALAERGDRRAIPALRELLGDPHFAFDAAASLGELGATEAAEDLASLGARMLAPLVLRAVAGGALARLGDPRGADILRRVIRAWRADGRSTAVELAGELGLVELVPDLVQLVRRPRAVDPVVLARALARLASRSDVAAGALEQLAHAEGEAGAIAREAIRPEGRS